MFVITQKMVSNPKWQAALVLPALHAQLAQGAAEMGHSMQSLLDLCSVDVEDRWSRVSLAMAEIALATQAGGSGTASRSAATDGAKVNEAVHEAADQLGRDADAREEV